MTRYFPAWTANNRVETHSGREASTSDPEQNEPQTFLLSSNWILLPEGLREFYDRLREAIRPPNITYDITLGAFRIRCPLGEEEYLVSLIHDTLDELVNSELDKLPENDRLRPEAVST